MVDYFAGESVGWTAAGEEAAGWLPCWVRDTPGRWQSDGQRFSKRVCRVVERYGGRSVQAFPQTAKVSIVTVFRVDWCDLLLLDTV